MFSLWHRFKRGEMSRDALWNALWPLRMRMKRCLMRVQADADADRKAKALSRDLLRQWDHLWTFAAVEGVDPRVRERNKGAVFQDPSHMDSGPGHTPVRLGQD
ncbi:MAG TPA: hypothetical protein PKV86_01870 [Syntrophobacteraceae bacterium]|nr:hypothetical protein [Syntrophobacteraceae bacterium]